MTIHALKGNGVWFYLYMYLNVLTFVYRTYTGQFVLFQLLVSCEEVAVTICLLHFMHNNQCFDVVYH